MGENAIDPAQRVTKFAKADDVAYVVEMENVSDKPIKLLDTRYGENYGESKGKAKSDWFGQFLFSIELFDGDGQKIERPEVQVVDLDGVLDGAMVASLDAWQVASLPVAASQVVECDDTADRTGPASRGGDVLRPTGACRDEDQRVSARISGAGGRRRSNRLAADFV